MTDLKDQYIETTDLYLEMLWQAQRVEDRKLIGMLHQRLMNLTAPQKSAAMMCRIIPFPVRRPQAPLADTVPAFWPARPVTGTLAWLATYCLLTFTGVLANLS